MAIGLSHAWRPSQAHWISQVPVTVVPTQVAQANPKTWASSSQILGCCFEVGPLGKRGFHETKPRDKMKKRALVVLVQHTCQPCVWYYLYVLVQWEPNTCLKTKSESTEQSRLARIPKTDGLVLTRLTLVIISISESQEIYPLVTKRILLVSESRIDGLVMSKFHLLHSSGGTNWSTSSTHAQHLPQFFTYDFLRVPATHFVLVHLRSRP